MRLVSYLTIIILLIVQNLNAQNQFGFRQIMAGNELFREDITDITQDSLGFIWIASMNGLYRYDGYNMRLFRHDSKIKNNLQSSNIQSLFVDHKGVLWVGTVEGGLSKYIQEKEEFITYMHNPDNDSSIGFNDINTITEDNSGNLWIGFRRGGLSKLDIEKEVFVNYHKDDSDPYSIISDDIFSLFVDSKNILWLSTYSEGLGWIDLNSDTFRCIYFQNFQNNLRRIEVKRVYSFAETKEGNIFMATLKGLMLLNKDKNICTNFMGIENDELISTGVINDVIIDADSSIWLSSINELIKLTPSVKLPGTYTPKRYKYAPGNVENIHIAGISVLFPDKDGNIWLGSTRGLVRGSKMKFDHIQLVPDALNHSFINNIVSFEDSPDGNLWIATWGQGIWEYNINSGELKELSIPGINDKFILKIFRIGDNYIIAHENNGFYVYSPSDKKAIYVSDMFYKNFVDKASVIDIEMKDRNTVWLGTNHGIFSFNVQTNSIQEHPVTDINKSGISSLYIVSICKDSRGRFC